MTLLASVGLWLAAGALGAVPAPKAAVAVCDDVHEPLTLDPQKEFSEKNHTIVQQIFEGLVRFAPDGRIVPALAVSWRRVDPLTMEFRLRRGVRFHDGEPFDAKAVKFSIERYLDPKTGFPAFGYIDSLDRVVVVDDATVRIRTKHEDGLLLNRLAGFIVIVAPRYYREKPAEVLRERPVGTGAFRFVRWERGKEIALKANSDYWDRSYPKIGALAFKFIPSERQVSALLSGDVDILTDVPGTRTLEVQRDSGAYVMKTPSLYTIAANFNTSRPPFSDPRVREAVNLAVDRRRLIRYDIFGNGLPVGTLSLSGEFGHNPDIKPYPDAPGRARRLLKAAGYARGIDVSLLLKANAARAGRIMARQLAAVGIRLHPTLVTDAELFDYLKDRSRWDMAVYSCPDPMYHAFFIRSIFLSGKSPFSLAPDAEIDRRLSSLVTALDPGIQDSISKELDSYIHSHYLALPLYQRLGVYGIRKGVRFIPWLSGMPYFDRTSIDDKRN